MGQCCWGWNRVMVTSADWEEDDVLSSRVPSHIKTAIIHLFTSVFSKHLIAVYLIYRDIWECNAYFNKWNKEIEGIFKCLSSTFINECKKQSNWVSAEETDTCSYNLTALTSQIVASNHWFFLLLLITNSRNVLLAMFWGGAEVAYAKCFWTQTVDINQVSICPTLTMRQNEEVVKS